MSADITPIRSMIASRLSSNPTFMAYVLTRYAEMENLTAEDLALELGTLPELIDRLALCRKPVSDDPGFAERVNQLADYVLVDVSILANVIRIVEAVANISEAVSMPLMAAARDREPDASPPISEEES